MEVRVRGIRGAITVENNRRQEILSATRELLEALVKENQLDIDDIVSAFFTVTSDLNAEFPAAAAREHLGWNTVPMLCALEIDVPGRLPRCIRVMLHVNTSKGQKELKNIYLKGARELRKDLANN